jgi:hypothetical protein
MMGKTELLEIIKKLLKTDLLGNLMLQVTLNTSLQLHG